MTTAPFSRTAGPGSGPEGAPSAIALSPILSARYRSRDLERIRAAAPGARIVTVSVEGVTVFSTAPPCGLVLCSLMRPFLP